MTDVRNPLVLIQYNEYYPFGLQASTSWTREDSKNDFLYNAGSELNVTSGWYETPFRNYDPVLGRFVSVDPMATKYASYSAYHYSYNNPVMFNDPSGADGNGPGPGYYDGNSCPQCFVGPTFDQMVANDLMQSYQDIGMGDIYANYVATNAYVGQVKAAMDAHYANYMKATGHVQASDGNWVRSEDLHREYFYSDATIIYYTLEGEFYIDIFPGTPAQQGGDCPRCDIADMIRYSPFLGGVANPFFLADAIYGDAGFSFVGAEKDWGGYFILSGKDKGKLIAFSEIAGGVAPDAGVGVEYGRVDVSGPENKFEAGDLFGRRNKAWVSWLFVGPAAAWGRTTDGRLVVSLSVQLGPSANPLEAVLAGFSGGYNKGVIKPIE